MITNIKTVLNRIVETITGACLISICLMLCVQVFCRYVLRTPLFWAEEVTRFCQIWLTFLGAAIVLRVGGHLSFDVLKNFLPPVFHIYLQIIINVFNGLLGLAMLYFGSAMTQQTWFVQSPALGFSRGWFYIAVPLGGALILIEAIYNCYLMKINRSR